MSWASSGHITKLKQSIFAPFNIYEWHTLKIVNNRLNTNIYSYLETAGGPSYNKYLNLAHFFNTSVN